MSRRTSRRQSLNEISFTTDVNASLWLDKFIEGYDTEETREISAETCKQKLISELVKVKLPEVYRAKFARWKSVLEEVGAKCRVLKVDDRMIVGLGGESVLETSIVLHRVYGVPFIPGSALKGLAASYAHRKLGGEWRRGGKFHNLVFGSQDFAGLVTFHDALLVPDEIETLPLHREIMTVHHAGYYGDGSEAPADWDSPNPIPFISASGKYLVALSCETGVERILERTFEILALALAEDGIGAKTSSGYGRACFERSEAEIMAEKENSQVENFINRLTALRNQDVAGQINAFYQEWKNSGLSTASKKRMAQAIIDKVRAAGREKQSKEKAWYQELCAFTKQD